MISNTIKAIGATCTIVAALAVVAVPTASAKHGNGRGVRVAGICDNGSTSKLKVKRDDGRLKFEFEVDQNLAGVVWDVTVTNDQVVVFEGQRTTRDPSGSFSVERRIKGAKSGTIVATATRESGETCTATLTIPAKTPVVKDPIPIPPSPSRMIRPPSVTTSMTTTATIPPRTTPTRTTTATVAPATAAARTIAVTTGTTTKAPSLPGSSTSPQERCCSALTRAGLPSPARVVFRDRDEANRPAARCEQAATRLAAAVDERPNASASPLRKEHHDE